LTTENSTSEVAEQQASAAERFWAGLAQKGFAKWRPTSDVCSQETRLLIGIAAYNGPDVELAQQVVGEALQHSRSLAVDFFDVQDVTSMQDFEKYIPGITPVYQTPAVGVWVRGQLAKCASGFAGRKLALETLDEIASRHPSEAA